MLSQPRPGGRRTCVVRGRGGVAAAARDRPVARRSGVAFQDSVAATRPRTIHVAAVARRDHPSEYPRRRRGVAAIHLRRRPAARPARHMNAASALEQP